MPLQSRFLTIELQKLRALISKASGLDDFELQAHWGRYLCVLVAGFLENALAEIYGDFAKSAASAPVASYVSGMLRRTKNPKSAAFVTIAERFSPTWARTLHSYIEEEGRKDAVDAIMANRNLIAHGRNSDITVVRVVDYLNKAVEMLVFLERLCQGR